MNTEWQTAAGKGSVKISAHLSVDKEGVMRPVGAFITL